MIDIETLNETGKGEVQVVQPDGTTLTFLVRRCHELLSTDVELAPSSVEAEQDTQAK